MPGTSTEAQLSALFSSTSLSGDDDLDSKLIEQPSNPVAEMAGPSADITAAVRLCRDMTFKPGSAEKDKILWSVVIYRVLLSIRAWLPPWASVKGALKDQKRTKTDNVCHPILLGTKKKKVPDWKKTKTKSNRYTKSAFKYVSHQTMRLA